MTPAEAFAVCETTVRRADEDRYLASLFAPTENRPLLFALYCFNHELARASEVARDPLAAEIRLQWWRDALEAARGGQPRAHPVAVGLAEILRRDPAQTADLEALIHARAVESSPAPFATLAAMESHARATSARLMQAAARLLAGTGEAADIIDDAGIAYGLAGMLRSVRFHALRGRLFLPSDLLATEFLSTVDIVSGRNSARLKRVFDEVISCALDHFRRATQNALPRAVLPAVLPASLVPAYLSGLTKNADHLYKRTGILRLRKQLILARAALFGAV
jgi:15-cis-phytoene synthase